MQIYIELMNMQSKKKYNSYLFCYLSLIYSRLSKDYQKIISFFNLFYFLFFLNIPSLKIKRYICYALVYQSIIASIWRYCYL